MHERHENEQYFFTQSTVDAVADALATFTRPCVLCAPLVGAELERRGLPVLTLDIDERFGALRSFRRWDLYQPEPLSKRHDVIFCDPPFFNVALSQLFSAVRVLAQHDFAQPLILSYLTRRRAAVLATFAPFNLRATGHELSYRSVQHCARNRIELLANVAFSWPETNA